MMDPAQSRPRLPLPLSFPLGLVPERVQSLAVAQALNRVFARERAHGELYFLEGKRVRVRVDDASTAFTISLGGGGFRAARQEGTPDLSVSGTLYDYLLLITGREDPDTLFFQRRLRMQGDTELGVYVKNFLAAVDPESLPLGNLVQPILIRGLSLYERLA
jgi:predicted lipid carrier protein YhbT